MDISMNEINISVIHLRRCSERLKNLNFLPNSVVNAYDGSLLDENYLKEELIRYTGNIFKIPYGRTTFNLSTRQKAACFLSHLKALNDYSKPSLILEDDFLYNGCVREIILKDVPNDYGLLWIGGKLKPRANNLKKPKLKKGWNLINPKHYYVYESHSYLVKEPQKLLELFKDKMPISYDCYLSKYISKKVKCYYLNPPMIFQNKKFSGTISHSKNNNMYF